MKKIALISTFCDTEEKQNIKIMINDKLKNSIILNDNNIEEFKLTNFMKYD